MQDSGHKKNILNLYGGKVRVRVCGLLENEGSLLMVNIKGLAKHSFWSPPGGGVEFGEKATDALTREFKEETGLNILVQEFLFVCEYIQEPLHAVELFFKVSAIGGKLITGIDPESETVQQIEAVAYKKWETIDQMKSNEKHGIFSFSRCSKEIMTRKGHFTLPML